VGTHDGVVTGSMAKSVKAKRSAGPRPRLERKEYEKQLRKLQAELCLLQDRVKHKFIPNGIDLRKA
jgi:hypothetical protein